MKVTANYFKSNSLADVIQKLFSLPSVTGTQMDKSIWLKRHRGEDQPAVSLCAKLITSQQYYCTIKSCINIACLLRVIPTTPLLPISFPCMCVCVWTHVMNSWHNVNLVHILGFKMSWPNLTSKKPPNPQQEHFP